MFKKLFSREKRQRPQQQEKQTPSPEQVKQQIIQQAGEQIGAVVDRYTQQYDTDVALYNPSIRKTLQTIGEMRTVLFQAELQPSILDGLVLQVQTAADKAERKSSHYSEKQEYADRAALYNSVLEILTRTNEQVTRYAQSVAEAEQPVEQVMTWREEAVQALERCLTQISPDAAEYAQLEAVIARLQGGLIDGGNIEQTIRYLDKISQDLHASADYFAGQLAHQRNSNQVILSGRSYNRNDIIASMDRKRKRGNLFQLAQQQLRKATLHITRF